ncbi:MAG: histidine phosphatase family protein [Clostridia bacterium]|nr:histidine phosphatase family protein [Clostridia bacterium]
MVTLILERHGQSEGNTKKLFTGHADIGLTPFGREQVNKSAEYIAGNYKVDKIYSSDLKRAVETAEFVAEKTGLKIIKSAKLRELYAGEWEGREFDEIEKNYPEDWKVWRNDIGNARCTGGESVKELGERFISAITEIARENEGKTVLITTHATPIRVTQCLLGGHMLGEMKNLHWGANASITVLEYDNDGWEIVLSGYDDHLGELKTSLPANV